MEFTRFSWWNAACLLLAVLLNFILGEFPGEAFRGFFFKVKETAATNGNCEADKSVESNGNTEANGNYEVESNCEANENYEAEGDCNANGNVEAYETVAVSETAGHGNPSGFSTEPNSTESESFRARLFNFLYRGILFVFIPRARTLRRVIIIAEFLKTFGILFIVQAFFAIIGFALKLPPRTVFYFPDGIAGFFSCAAVFLAAAFYEETLYRAYLPFSLKRMFRKKGRPQTERSRTDAKSTTEADSAQGGTRERFSDAAAEVAAIAIFGLSHASVGALSVANALVAGFFLRRCAVRTGGIKAGLFAHFLYNTLTLAIFYAAAWALR